MFSELVAHLNIYLYIGIVHYKGENNKSQYDKLSGYK